jgi:hypothetical protein
MSAQAKLPRNIVNSMLKDREKLKAIHEKTGQATQFNIDPEMMRGESSPQVEKMYQEVVGKEKKLSRSTTAQKKEAAMRRVRRMSRPLVGSTTYNRLGP